MQEPGGPGGVLDGEAAHEGREPGVALLAALVEGLLRDEVGDGEEEELGAGVAYVPGAAPVVGRERTGRGDGRGGPVRAERSLVMRWLKRAMRIPPNSWFLMLWFLMLWFLMLGS
ncbi:hypothetical protein Smic_16110 [Streptomyces microflavus]|uniref:Uncharacterized protein n=1 Tax=Streptomyces microflavus TaxID=1919 RepID=A0A7J0CMR2_STRMI|nr:hypothetical protein Smic_16110 [Streptomyces microflavus]